MAWSFKCKCLELKYLDPLFYAEHVWMLVFRGNSFEEVPAVTESYILHAEEDFWYAS